MTLLWLFALLWLLSWTLAHIFVSAAIAWLVRYPGNSYLQPRRILLVCAMPWLIPAAAIVAMVSLAAAKRWGWLHDHCLSHAPHHPHFCFEHLSAMLINHGHGHVVVASAIFMVLGVLAIRHWRSLRRQSMRLNALTALSHGRGLLRVVEDSRVTAFAAGAKQPHIYLSQGLRCQLNRRERRMVVAHEAAHVRHRDLLFGRWVEHLLLLHFKPCAELLRRLWRDAIEVRADEDVAIRFGRIETAELLLRFAKSMGPAPTPTAFGGGDPVARIYRLLHDMPSAPRDKPIFEAMFVAGLLALMTGFFVSHHTLETILGVLIRL